VYGLACYAWQVRGGAAQFSLPRFRRGAFWLFLLPCVLSMVFADRPWGTILALSPGALQHGQGLWQPLTANFVYLEGELGGLIGTLFVQWFVGSTLEGFWGTRRYVLLVVGAGFVGYLVAALFGAFVPDIASVVMSGATPMDLAAIVAFGVVYGKQPVHLFGIAPLSARGLAVLIAVLSVIAPLGRGTPWPHVVPWSVAMLVALVATTQPWRKRGASGKLGRKAYANGTGKTQLRVVQLDRRRPN